MVPILQMRKWSPWELKYQGLQSHRTRKYKARTPYKGVTNETSTSLHGKNVF